MILSIASGKGGTGKTTIAVNLALYLENVQFLDCDVEEPNAHIFLKPELTEKISVEIPVPQVDEIKCSGCEKCAEVCEFNAIVVINKKVLFFPELCHGCGACTYFCPDYAIREVTREVGVIERGISGKIEFIHGILNVGEPMAPPIIRMIKGLIRNNTNIIIDASPGTSCPVVESVKGSDFSILVTEPTPFGLNDLRLAVEMIRKLKIPFGVVINCADIGDKETERFCINENIPILMTMPWDRRIAESYSRGIPLLNALPEYRKKFIILQDMIQKEINK